MKNFPSLKIFFKYSIIGSYHKNKYFIYENKGKKCVIKELIFNKLFFCFYDNNEWEKNFSFQICEELKRY